MVDDLVERNTLVGAIHIIEWKIPNRKQIHGGAMLATSLVTKLILDTMGLMFPSPIFTEKVWDMMKEITKRRGREKMTNEFLFMIKERHGENHYVEMKKV